MLAETVEFHEVLGWVPEMKENLFETEDILNALAQKKVLLSEKILLRQMRGKAEDLDLTRVSGRAGRSPGSC